MQYLTIDGVYVGQVDDGVDFVPPSEDFELTDVPPEPLEPFEIITGDPASMAVSTFVPFSQHSLFEQARDAAKTNPAIQVEFVTAMYASNQGDTTLLQSAIENLEELLE